MAPCAPVLLDEDSLWSSVKRDSTNAIVLQASAVVEACSAAFSGSSGACPYRTVVVGDNGVALAVVAQAASLAEGEKDWEWAVIVLKSEFRRKAPSPQKLTEHFVSLWNKTHPRNVSTTPHKHTHKHDDVLNATKQSKRSKQMNRWRWRSRSGRRRGGAARRRRKSCAS